MNSAAACTMIVVGSLLMMIPAAVMLAFAESLKNDRGGVANLAHVLHALLCTVVGIVLIAMGGLRRHEIEWRNRQRTMT